MLGETLEVRFWNKVNKTKDCWLWTSTLNNGGYGTISRKGRLQLAHRVSYELNKSEIPAGLVIDHLCSVTACVNPEHLEAVTQKENLKRGLHRKPLEYCARGHRLTQDNRYNRIEGGRLHSQCRRCRLDRKRNQRKFGRQE